MVLIETDNMKTAHFKFQTRGKSVIFGTVTLKNDGKVSISLAGANRYNSCAADRYQAKQLGKKIAEADFNHPEAYNLKVTNTSGLVDILKKETTELKTKFIERTIEYADKHYVWAEKVSNMSEEELVAKYGTRNLTHPYFSKGERITTTLSELGEKSRSEANSIVAKGLKEYKAGEVKNAERHYADSIESLALRLNAKGIKDDTQMTIKTATIGVHITTTIHHSGTTTKAWTIIAEGVVQRPHYRYLVK